MSPDEDALLAGIAAAPADDLPRLVYADWLEEHGRGVRAEFIRLQIEIAKLEVGPRALIDANVPLWKRQQELLDGHLDEFLGPLADRPESERCDCKAPVFERGFLASVWLHEADFLRHAQALAASRPVPAVHVVRAGSWTDAEEWAGLPGRGLVVELDMADSNWFHQDLPEPDPSWWRALTRLRTLNLADNDLGDDRAEAIPWADLPALADLDVSNNNLSDAGVIALINTGLPQRLERLILGGNPIGDPSAYELADRVGASRTLKHLNLRYTDITNAGQLAILARFPGRVDLF